MSWYTPLILAAPPSLHPEVPGRKGELLVRRRLIEASLQLMQRCHLVDQESAEEGIVYRASEEAAAYVELLETDYSVQMKACARWLAEQVKKCAKERSRSRAGSVLVIISAQTSHSCSELRAIMRHSVTSSREKRCSQKWVVSVVPSETLRKPISCADRFCSSRSLAWRP